MLYICDVFFIFSLIFIIINNLIKTDALVFVYFLEYFLLFLEDSLDDKSKSFSKGKSSASGCYLAFAWFFANFSMVLFIKVLLIRKSL